MIWKMMKSVIQDMDNSNVVMKWDDDDPMSHAQKTLTVRPLSIFE
jgi:hypothetical protein